MKEQSFHLESENPNQSSQTVPPEAKPEMTAEVKQRMEELITLGKVIGEDFGVKVEVGKERGWRYIFKPYNKIEVDPVDIVEKSKEYCWGVLAHEGAHRNISRVDFIPKNVWQTTGFSFLMNAVEDPRVNNFAMQKYKGAREWLNQVYLEDLPVDHLDMKAKDKLGYTPKHIKYGLEIIRYWFYQKFSENLPEDVQEALDETNQYAELAYETLPDIKDPKEDDIVEQAKRVYNLVYNTIWPVYEQLIDKSFEDEEMRQKIKDMIENSNFDLPEEGQGANGEPLPLDQIPEDLREQLKKKLKEWLDGLSEEDRKKWEEKAAKAAEDSLDGLEDDLNKELKGHFVKQKKSAKEEKEDEEKKKEDKAKERENRKTLRDLEKKLEAQKSEYDKAYESVAKYIDDVADDLINAFILERFPKFKTRFPGQRLRLKGAMKWAATKEYRELFETRKTLERESFTFLLLIDLSGSMDGEKIAEAFKSAVLLSEALERVGNTLPNLKVAIYGFQDKLIKFKDFDDKMDDAVRERMSGMKDEAAGKNSRPGANNENGHNSDAYCVDEASQILAAAGGDSQFLIVTSDGQPAPAPDTDVQRYADLDKNEQLKEVIKDISRQGEQYVLGTGIGPGTDHVQEFYDDSLPRVKNLPSINIDDYAQQIGDTVKGLIQKK